MRYPSLTQFSEHSRVPKHAVEYFVSRMTRQVFSIHPNVTDVSISLINLVPTLTVNDLPDDCLSIIFNFVCQNNSPESESSNQWRLVCKQWRDIYESYRPVTITLANMPGDQAISRLQQCVSRRLNARVMSVSFDNLDPPPSLQTLLPALTLSRAFAIQLAIKGSPTNPTLIEDEDILAISAALGDKITRLSLDSENMRLTDAGLADIAQNMRALNSLSLKFYATPLTDTGCEHISDMTNLTELSLSTALSLSNGDPVGLWENDDSFECLDFGRMKALRRLEISNYLLDSVVTRYWPIGQYT